MHYTTSEITYQHPDQQIPEVIAKLMNLVLKNNVFEFDEKFYLQTQGTAMGTKMAPAYANLFMGKLEERLRQIGNKHILLWRRFIDDIFIVWTGTETEFLNYIQAINKPHKTITGTRLP